MKDDLSHNPSSSLLDTASDKEILALNEDANNHPEYPLAGAVRYLLNARANTIVPTEDTEITESSQNLTPLERARAAAAARS